MKSNFILLLIITQLAGCASYYASKSNYNAIINEWLENDEYHKINTSLKELSRSHPDYKSIAARKNSLKLKENLYIKKSITDAKKYLLEEKWQHALEIYEIALEKSGPNKKILEAKDVLIKERNTQVSELRKNMLLRRSRALVQYKPIYDKLTKLIPNDYSAQYDINKFKNEKDGASNQLINCGHRALQEKDYNLAEECFKLSNQLITLKETQVLINKVSLIIKQKSNKKKTADLINAYHKAYKSGNFPKARLHLDQLLTINPEHKKSKQLKMQLDRNINTRVEKSINLGKTQYSEGKINAALKTWENSSKLDPKNEELSALINRAKKVSSKIEKLEKSPAN